MPCEESYIGMRVYPQTEALPLVIHRDIHSLRETYNLIRCMFLICSYFVRLYYFRTDRKIGMVPQRDMHKHWEIEKGRRRNTPALDAP